MLARLILGLVLLAAATQAAVAQNLPWQFRWQKGQTLSYQIKHVTAVAETVDGTTVESEAKLDLTKRWQVVELDAQGVATIEMSLSAMRNEQKRPGGEVLLFDSQDLDKSTPALKEQMGKFIGQKLAVLRVDGYGRVLDVKLGSKARFEAEPPFALVFPKADAQAGQAWVRPYKIVLEPPQGTGESYAARERFHCTKLADGKATLSVKTEFESPPESLQDRVPLLQKEIEGQALFDLQAGRLEAVHFSIDRTLENHQGKGSSYRFKSDYSERYVE